MVPSALVLLLLVALGFIGFIVAFRIHKDIITAVLSLLFMALQVKFFM